MNRASNYRFNRNNSFAFFTAAAVLLLGLSQSEAASSPAATTTTLVSTPNPSTQGQSVKLTATVSVKTATGTMTFMDGTNTLGTASLTGGTAILALTSLSAASHSLTAAYAGDANNSASTSPAITQTVTVPPTTVTLKSSVNPSNCGQSVTWTVTISPSTATGNVTFYDGTTALGTSTVNSGIASMSLATLAGGAHAISAIYGGDAHNPRTISATITQTVNQAKTTTTLTSSANPAGSGQSLTLTVTVSPTTATGSVTFMDGKGSLGSSPLNSSGIATLPVNTLSTGAHTLTAVYAGDANTLGSTSASLKQTINLATTLTLTSSANPSPTGQSLTLTATLSVSDGTGSVTFLDGSTALGKSTIASGTATLAVTSLSAGAHSLTAVYSGDATYASSTSPALSENVSAASSTITLSSSANPSTSGQNVTLTATVSPSQATGTVTFKDGTATLGSGTLAKGTATLSLATLSSGTHTLTAAYGGDKSDSASTSATLSQTVNSAASTTTLTSSANPSTAGQSVTLTATVSPSQATGTVTFKDGSATLGSGSLAKGTATLTLTTLSSGTHTLTAAYSGDQNNAASVSAAVSQTVNLTATTTALTSSANPSSTGQSVTLTATVSPTSASGSVTFKDGSATLGSGTLNNGTATLALSNVSTGAHTLTAVYGGDSSNSASTSAALTQNVNLASTSISLKSSANPSTAGQSLTLTATVSPSQASGSVTFNDGSATLGSGNLSGGTATLSVTNLSSGAHNLTAVYSGDANDAGSTSTSLSQTVNLGATSITLKSSANPAAAGQSLTLTATVSPSQATGSVTFNDGSATLGSGNLSGGTATLSLINLSSGAHTLTAVYSGDANDAGSTSASLSQTVNLGATSVTLKSSANPSTAGQSLTLTATVSPSQAGGSVTFNDGTATLGSGTLSGGTATLSLTNLSSGAHTLTAVYGGDATDAGSTSAALAQTVNLATTSVSLKSSANPSTAGQSVTLTATVSPSQATGSVTFNDGTATLGSGTLSGGTATLSLTNLSSGAHTLTAVYGGDSINAGSTSAALTQTVNLATTTITLTSSANPSTYGQGVTLTATVSPSQATGTVTFKDGSASLGSGTLSGGNATLQVTTFSSGSHALTAVYSGDADYAAGSSPAVNQTITLLATSTTLSASPNPSAYGQSVLLMATVSPSGTGSVTFKDGSITLGSGALNAGTASLAVTTLAVGSHSLTAVYSGDANTATSTSATVTQTVNQVATSTTLTTSPNPSTPGQSVLLTATVPSGGTGSVTFNDGPATLGSSTLNGGTATFSIATLSGGSHALTAIYSGDVNNAASTSPVVTQMVSQAMTSTVLTSSANPSAAGQTVTLTATVSPSQATGTISFNDGGAPMGSSALSAGIATLTVTSLSNGAHVLTAVYSGDSNNAASTSAVLTQSVNQLTTATTLDASPNPSAAGQAVNLTATVSPSQATGTVAFNDGAAPLGSGALVGGTATLTVTTLSGGSHTLTSIYSGDAAYATSTSAALAVTITQVATSTTLTTSANPSAPGQSVALTGTVSLPAVTGTVSFKDGSATLGSGTLNGGTAILNVAALSTGIHALTATYSGDTTHAGSTSAALSQTVNGIVSASPCTPVFSYTAGQAVLNPIVCQFSAMLSDSFVIPSNSIAPWLQVNPMSGQLGPSPASFTISVNPSGLAPGGYSGGFTITGPTLGTLMVPVQLTVTGGAPTGMLVSTPASLSLNYQQGSAAPPAQTVTVSSTNGTQLPFTVTANGGNWLIPGVTAGTSPQPFNVTINPLGLDVNTYNGSLTISFPGAASIVVNVTLTVTASMSPQLSISTSPVSLASVQGAPPAMAQIQVSNVGGGVLNFTAAASGGAWLNVSPSTGVIDNTASTAQSSPVMMTADATSLDPGTYSGSLVITGAGTSATIPITFSVAAPAPSILLSQAGLTFTAVAQGGVPLPQQVGILNAGTGTLDWTATASTLSGGNWLLVSAPAGTIQRPFLDVSLAGIAVDPAVATTLAPGDYYGQIAIAGAAVNSPQLVTVILTVLPPGSDPGPEVSPASLIFTGQAGTSPPPQTVTIGVRKAGGDQYLSSSTGAGFTYSAASAALQPNQPASLQVAPDFTSVVPGETDQGSITLQFSDGSVRTINLLTVVAPSAGPNACSNLNLVWRTPSSPNFTVVQGSAQALEIQVVDNCGNLIGPDASGGISIVAAFSNQDAPVNLVHIGNGIWTGTWKPVIPPSGPVTVTVAGFNNTGPVQQSGQASPLFGTVAPGTTPIVSAGGVQAAASMVAGAPIAPGSLITLQGSNLVDLNPADTQVFLGMESLPLIHSASGSVSGQVNVQVPFDVPMYTGFQLTVQRNSQQSLPQQLIIAPSQPGIFTADGSGTGQGVIYRGDGALAQPGTPAVAGEVITIYCTGLGTVTPTVPAGTPPPTEPLSSTDNTVALTIGGQDGQASFGTLVPGEPGVYQVSATVPGGVSGDNVPVVVTVAGQSSPAVTMAVQ